MSGKYCHSRSTGNAKKKQHEIKHYTPKTDRSSHTDATGKGKPNPNGRITMKTVTRANIFVQPTAKDTEPSTAREHETT